VFGGLYQAKRGKPVQIRHGPAAVCGDETRKKPLYRKPLGTKRYGKAWGVGRSTSQKTCRSLFRILGEKANPQADYGQFGDFF